VNQHIDTATDPPIAAARTRKRSRLRAIRHALHLIRRPLQFLESLPEQGDIVEVWFGFRPAYVVCRPDLVHQLLVNSRVFDKGGPQIERARRLAGNGLFASAYEEHKRQRRIVQLAFHRERLPGYSQVMIEETTAELARWRDGTTIDIVESVRRITARAAARTMFVADVAGPVVNEFPQALTTMLEGSYRRMIIPIDFLYRLPLPSNRRYDHALRRMHEIVEEMIHTYRAAGVDHGDLMSMLLAARDDDGDGLSDPEIHEQVYTLVAGSFETTTSTICCALQLLGTHQEIAERVRAEVDATTAGGAPGYADLPELDLTRRVVTETLRLYPSGWIFNRTATQDTELGGYPIAAGSTLIYSPYLVHHRADLYDGADRFDPDRWLPGRAQAAPRGAYIPFGGGARKCIGSDLSLTEITLILATVFANWVLTPVDGAPTRPRPRMALTMNRLPMRAERRARPGSRPISRFS